MSHERRPGVVVVGDGPAFGVLWVPWWVVWRGALWCVGVGARSAVGVGVVGVWGGWCVGVELYNYEMVCFGVNILRHSLIARLCVE